jgi:hypothetical protein
MTSANSFPIVIYLILSLGGTNSCKVFVTISSSTQDYLIFSRAFPVIRPWGAK